MMHGSRNRPGHVFATCTHRNPVSPTAEQAFVTASKHVEPGQHEGASEVECTTHGGSSIYR
jgi:hypothetical protein